MAIRTNVIGTVSSIFRSARLSSRSTRRRLRSFGFISYSFMVLKRLGCDGTIDILNRESNGSITAMEVEAHDQSKPKKAKQVTKRSVGGETVRKTKIRTEDVKVDVSCTFPSSQALTVSANSR
jgi:hypothetical protein